MELHGFATHIWAVMVEFLNIFINFGFYKMRETVLCTVYCDCVLCTVTVYCVL
jgi:hypothetical protein